MKLYTEEEVIRAIKLTLDSPTHADLVVDYLTPIELPSDEEIENGYEPKTMYDLGYLDGAKWMRDKIVQGGDK